MNCKKAIKTVSTSNITKICEPRFQYIYCRKCLNILSFESLTITVSSRMDGIESDFSDFKNKSVHSNSYVLNEDSVNDDLGSLKLDLDNLKKSDAISE